MNTHSFTDSGTAYNETQVRDQQMVGWRIEDDPDYAEKPIEDGDVLVCEDGVVGYLYKAWPVAVTANHGVFHTTSQRDRVRWRRRDPRALYVFIRGRLS